MNGTVVGAVLIGLVLWMRGSSSAPSVPDDPSDDGVPPNPRAGATPVKLQKMSEHYVLADFLVSAHHPDLVAALAPDETQVRNIQALAEGPLEGIVSQIDATPTITSGFRSADLNAAISGHSETSQHMAKGDSAAADLWPPDLMDQAMLADALVASKKPWDQAIIYSRKRGGQLHVSHRRTGKNRYALLIAPDDGGYKAVKDVAEAITLLGETLV